MPPEEPDPTEADVDDETGTAGGGDTGPRPGLLGRLRRDMSRNEQLVVYLGAVLALGINLFVAASPTTVTHGSKTTHVSTPIVIVIGVGSFILLSIVARYGRRTVAAIAALLVSFVTAQPLGFAYIALGAWLFYKGTRSQRQRLATERAAAGGGRSAAAGRTATAGRPDPRATRNRRTGRARQPEAPRRPASKRYTPPGTKGRRR